MGGEPFERHTLRLLDMGRRITVIKYAPSPDVNGDGCVDDADLLTVLFAFGQGC